MQKLLVLPAKCTKNMKLKKGDKVVVIAGKDKGKQGIIERVYIKQNKVLIPKVNIYKRHIKKSEASPQGGVVELPRLIDISKVMFISPKTGKPTRIGYKISQGKKSRVAKKTGEILN